MDVVYGARSVNGEGGLGEGVGDGLVSVAIALVAILDVVGVPGAFDLSVNRRCRPATSTVARPC